MKNKEFTYNKDIIDKPDYDDLIKDIVKIETHYEELRPDAPRCMSVFAKKDLFDAFDCVRRSFEYECAEAVADANEGVDVKSMIEAMENLRANAQRALVNRVRSDRTQSYNSFPMTNLIKNLDVCINDLVASNISISGYMSMLKAMKTFGKKLVKNADPVDAMRVVAVVEHLEDVDRALRALRKAKVQPCKDEILGTMKMDTFDDFDALAKREFECSKNLCYRDNCDESWWGYLRNA